MSQQFARDVSLDGVRGHGENVFLGALAGLVAAGIGTAIWVEFHVSYVALAVGALVGLAIRFLGNGRSSLFGLMAVIFTVLGCISGEVLARIQALTSSQHDFYDVLTTTDLVTMVTVIATKASVVDYVIYGVSVIGAYMLSVRK